MSHFEVFATGIKIESSAQSDQRIKVTSELTVKINKHELATAI